MIFRPRFFYWLLFACISWLISHFGTWIWLNFLVLFFFFLPLFSFFSLFIHRRRIRCQLEAGNSYVERGEVATWFFSLHSNYFFSKTTLYGSYRESSESIIEQLAPFTIAANEEIRLALQLEAKHTGPLRPYLFELRILDPLGFFSFKLIHFETEKFAPVYVLPRSLISILDKEESRAYMEGGESISKKSEHNLDEIDLVRKMQTGDHRRNIHWKISSRMQSWMVKQYEKADENELSFLFNLPNIDFEQPNSERDLILRDLLLDNVSEAAQSFLNQDFIIKVQIRRPWPDTVIAKDLEEYEFLRMSLASLEYKQIIPFSRQLMEESLESASRFYCVFSHELTPEIVTELLILAAYAQGILLRLISPTSNPPREWRQSIERLSAAGIRVSLNRQFRQADKRRRGGI